ncbi:hypothetical protein [Methyloversatilis sp.]|uniref:hypothetical protein n=1 Tax=Methyloversatilis sp. TaxID=2569862 RepID=UPI0027362F24|nr:hypothetical protein [Methyloversatilis sp.]MDP2867742.1 hypothetical protein [Methyloversatilis sp.]MDP3455493.1 hypothetical protein [Methyloversatilis sp.]MDP3701303.1 hypothetical protein [Hylemonella sp.]
MTTTKETKKAVQEAAQLLELKRMDAQRISDLINAQPAAFDARRLAKAREKAEDLSAAVMLGEASREALDDARADVASLEFEESTAAFEARQFAEGRAGLERRLSEAHGAIEDAEQELIEATGTWLNAELEDADREYTKAAQKAAEALVRVKTIGAMLDYRSACPTATSCSIDIRLPVIGPVSLAESAGTVGGGLRGVVVAFTRKDSELSRTQLLIDFKNLGALWPLRLDR